MRFYFRLPTRERLMLVIIAALVAGLLTQRLQNQASLKRFQLEAKTAKWMTYANDGVLAKNGYKVIDGKLVKLDQEP